MTWWLLQHSRLQSEKLDLAVLEGDVDWLQVSCWQANSSLEMCVDFRISHGSRDFAFQMVYPSVFPDVPPMIYTEDHSRISNHQYGPDGELCLEHRPDNWMPTVTGADMIRSCQRLLSEEYVDSEREFHARSAHENSLARDLRSKSFRLILSKKGLEALNTIEDRTCIPLTINNNAIGSTYVASVKMIGRKEDPFWSEESLLPGEEQSEDVYALRLSGFQPTDVMTTDDLKNQFEACELHQLVSDLVSVDEVIYLLVGDADNWVLLIIFGKITERKIMPYATVLMPEDEHRLPTELQALAEKIVGIVGCGSVGSKVAASLCRSGVGKFLLIDEDVFFPGNAVRNELSLREVGAHKSYAVRQRLQDLNPSCMVRALRLSLGGQESAKSMANAIEALGECDLLIDATASPVAFNLIASVATRRKKPMIWAEVYAGGVGGLVARARPDIDPVPLSARAQLETWYSDQDVDWVRADKTAPYSAEGPQGQPLIAGDPEVSVIASHTSAFAVDILSRPDASSYPVSAYVIGLSSEWIFQEPFDTRPVELMPDGDWGEKYDDLTADDYVRILQDHLPVTEDADENPTPQ
ncbi:ThiF family adenylyltransferase [Thalassospira marina]|uniref:THIF-type NAD/FAD binding fold domain-containing protein n=1 Tax=Thalassospira marina TaxID=2048283 RepID=A0A2N3KYQ6_9PROT|nr:ThiF family adenylyltransferase [Thalassospira marina]PKR55606.1 hypothetical protein COO20_05455 [Thalassospira marina]